jgi:alpha-N-arabinofuranosidase
LDLKPGYPFHSPTNQEDPAHPQQSSGARILHLDELEFLMGLTSTKNGALRTSLGYPNPWKINCVEIGNKDKLNNSQASYSLYRFSAFYNAAKAKYPDMTIIASYAGMSLPSTAGQDYHVYNRPNLPANQFDYFNHSSRSHKTLIEETSIVATSFVPVIS